MKKVFICIIVLVVIIALCVILNRNRATKEEMNIVEESIGGTLENTLEGNKLEQTIDEKENLKIKDITTDFYGNITIGSKTLEMYCTEDEITAAGFEKDSFGVGYYKDPETEDFFNYKFLEYESSGKREIEVRAYNDVQLNNGVRGSTKICKYIKLPGNITFDSTFDDVKAVYGEPTEIKEGENLSGSALLSSDTDETAKIVTYAFNDGNGHTMGLRLYFLESDNKLYSVYYVINLPKNVEE